MSVSKACWLYYPYIRIRNICCRHWGSQTLFFLLFFVFFMMWRSTIGLKDGSTFSIFHLLCSKSQKTEYILCNNTSWIITSGDVIFKVKTVLAIWFHHSVVGQAEDGQLSSYDGMICNCTTSSKLWFGSKNKSRNCGKHNLSVLTWSWSVSSTDVYRLFGTFFEVSLSPTPPPPPPDSAAICSCLSPLLAW